MGAAYGTSKAGVGIMISGISSPDLVYKNLIPIIMAGVNGMYVRPDGPVLDDVQHFRCSE